MNSLVLYCAVLWRQVDNNRLSEKSRSIRCSPDRDTSLAVFWSLFWVSWNGIEEKTIDRHSQYFFSWKCIFHEKVDKI